MNRKSVTKSIPLLDLMCATIDTVKHPKSKILRRKALKAAEMVKNNG